MTAVTIQSNKIVSNEVKDNEALLEPSYGKNQMSFLANSIHKNIRKKFTNWRKGNADKTDIKYFTQRITSWAYSLVVRLDKWQRLSSGKTLWVTFSCYGECKLKQFSWR